MVGQNVLTRIVTRYLVSYNNSLISHNQILPMFQFIPVHEENIFAVRASGKLTDKDYQRFHTNLSALIQSYEKISLLIELDDIHGTELKTLKDDFKFVLEQDEHFEKVAIVGEKKWQQWMTLLAQPFVESKIKYFNRIDLKDAWDWLRDKQLSDDKLADLPITPYQKVLVATDFSPHSEHAARRAMQIANAFNASLQLVNIVDEAALYDLYYEPGGAGLMMMELSMKALGLMESENESLQDKANAQMTALLNELGLEPSQGTVLTGRPASTLISYAEAQQSDLIVLGTHGRRGMDVVLGSVTRYIQSHARGEVLSVPLAGK